MFAYVNYANYSFVCLSPTRNCRPLANWRSTAIVPAASEPHGPGVSRCSPHEKLSSPWKLTADWPTHEVSGGLVDYSWPACDLCFLYCTSNRTRQMKSGTASDTVVERNVTSSEIGDCGHSETSTNTVTANCMSLQCGPTIHWVWGYTLHTTTICTAHNNSVLQLNLLLVLSPKVDTHFIAR